MYLFVKETARLRLVKPQLRKSSFPLTLIIGLLTFYGEVKTESKAAGEKETKEWGGHETRLNFYVNAHRH